MKAVIVKQPGGAEQLTLVDYEQPSPADHELLIEVRAAAINRTDIIYRESTSRYSDFDILGVEVAGVVGDGGKYTTIKPVTPVMVLTNGDGYAEYAVRPENRVI